VLARDPPALTLAVYDRAAHRTLRSLGSGPEPPPAVLRSGFRCPRTGASAYGTPSPLPRPLNGTFKLGTAFGVPIHLHWTFLVLAVFLVSIDPTALIYLPVLFGCVLLHELGHSLAARRYGIRVHDITLLPIGGMARMSEMPENAEGEGVVAFAGPAVNFVLAALGLGPLAVGVLLPSPTWATVGLTFAVVNLMLGGFNLLPAFPMDGGRILRAILARRRDWVSATEGAVRVGRWLAGAMLLTPFVLPLFVPGSGGQFLMLPLIALFVWFSGGRELIGVRLRHGLPPFKGMQLVGGMPGAFGPGRARPTPTAPSGPPPPPPEPESAAPGEARRPTIWQEVDGAPRHPQRGFDADDIRALERFRGRLRRPGP